MSTSTFPADRYEAMHYGSCGGIDPHLSLPLKERLN
jgi:hypothetical protein